jgi:hypothetical protein
VRIDDVSVGVNARIAVPVTVIRLQEVAVLQNYRDVALVTVGEPIPREVAPDQGAWLVVLIGVEQLGDIGVVLPVREGAAVVRFVALLVSWYLLAHGAEQEVRNDRAEATLGDDLLGRRGRSVLRSRGPGGTSPSVHQT